MASHLPSEDAWTRARNRFIEDLTHEEKQLYLQASPQMIFYDASAAVKRHAASSTSPGLIDKLQPFIAGIEQYGQALDIYSNAYPLALSPLWGSIRVLLVIAREFGKYFEKLVDMFARIGDVLPRFQLYERLFPDHERLTQALSVVYVDVIVFCSDIKAVFRRGQRASLTNLKVGFKLIWKPFESQFGRQIENFRNHQKNVEKEIGLSHMVEAADARALTLANRLQLEKKKKENKHRRVIERITSIDVEAKHRRLQNLRFHGTGEWVLQSEKYLEWKYSASSSFLCCCGIPGSGKSVLVSRIIDNLSVTATGPQVATVYYYCDYADQTTLQTDRILASMLKQLIPGDLIPKEIEPQILRAYKDLTRPPGTHDLTELVCSSMHLHQIVYIVLDGLDECERLPRLEILGFLERLSTLAKTYVRTFISCRDEDQLLRALKSYPRIQLTAAAVANDIKSFVEGSVKSRIESGQLTIRNPELEHQIVRELVDKAHGMFLWIYFQLNDLCEALSDAMVRQTLRDLPVGLVQTYERILLKISKSPLAKQEFALRAFKWTVCSRRPMKAEELQEAVAFESSDMTWDRDKIPNENLMIEACRGLLVRDDQDKTVRFAHHTVQQYLLSAPTVRTLDVSTFSIPPRTEAESFVGQVCVAYLCFSDFETQITLRTQDVKIEPVGVLKNGGLVRMPTVLGIGKSLLEIPYRLLGGKSTTLPLNIDYGTYLTPRTQTRPLVQLSLMEKYRLLEYISEYWVDHTKELNLALDARFRNLVLHKTLSFEFRPWGPNRHFGPYGCASCLDHGNAKELPYMSLFHYSAQAGHWNLMESLVAEYCQHEAPLDETLLIASRHGQELIVQNLMQRFMFDISDGRAVNVAVAAGHAEVLECFMILGEQSEEKSRFAYYNIIANASSLLNLAATNGHEKVVDIIFKYCRPSSVFYTQRDWSSVYSDESAWISAYVNETDERTGRTALFSAVMGDHENIIRKLLERGAGFKFNESRVLHIAVDTAVEHGRPEILRMLLDAVPTVFGIDVEDKAEEKAAKNGHSAVVRLILGRLILECLPRLDLPGWDLYQALDRSNHEGFTALHLAARGGHLNVVEILIEHGASPGLSNSESWWTALHLAAAEGHEAVVQWLLWKGANSNARTRNGAIPIQLALKGGYEGVVQALLTPTLRNTETVHAFNLDEMVALIEIAAKDKNEFVLRALLDHISHLDIPSVEEVQWEAKQKNYDRAIDLLTSCIGVAS